MFELLMRGICEVHHSDGLRWHDLHIKFHKDRFRRSEVVTGETHRHTHTQSKMT
jgi:hypothetical protein